MSSIQKFPSAHECNAGRNKTIVMHDACYPKATVMDEVNHYFCHEMSF